MKSNILLKSIVLSLMIVSLSPFEYEYIRFLYFKYRKLQAELGSEVF